MSSPDLSILTSVHGTGEWLPEALASLEVQKFCTYETLICANGQDDADVLARLGITPTIVNRETVSLSDALNRLLGYARGECAMRYDPDDKLPVSDNRLLVDQVELAQRGHVVYGGYMDFGERAQHILASPATADNLYRHSVGPYNYVARTDLFRAVGGWREVGYEDWDLLVRLIAAGGKPVALNRIALCHRVRSDGRLATMTPQHEAHVAAIRLANAEWFIRNGVQVL